MRRIADTIARLVQIEARQRRFAATFEVAENLIELTDFGSNPGALTAHSFVPSNLQGGAPLVVVLHGCTQTAAAYDRGAGWSQLAARSGFALLFPEQRRINNPSLCFNWFQPSDVRRGYGEALSIRQMIEAMTATAGLDPKRIFITGLSAGGAMAQSMLASYPEVFAGGAVIAGLPHGSASTIPQAFDRMRGHGTPSRAQLQEALLQASPHVGPWPRVSIWHGEADRTVAPSNADAVAAQWLAVHKARVKPDAISATGNHTRKTWTNGGGEVVLEINTISGMGHGTPIGEGVGLSGPYILDVGHSSTQAIARFWGICSSGVARVLSTKSPAVVMRAQSTNMSTGTKRTLSGSNERPDPHATPKSTKPQRGVKRIIEDALRAAGLMK